MLASKIKRQIQRKQSVKPRISKKAKQNCVHPTTAIQRHVDKMNSSGSTLPQNTKSFMESRIGADFSDVRIHNDNNAVQMSEDLNAQAFTHGNDIYFNKNKYNPESNTGKHLLAHELTHTIQQTGNIQRKEGEGHDLSSADLRGDAELEAVFDGEKVLKNGAKGNHVKKLQNVLIKLGFTLPIFGADGSYGNETTNAVVKFQSASGLTGVDVDGRTGKKTLGLMDMASRDNSVEKDTDKKSEDFIIRGKPPDSAKKTFQVFYELGESKMDADEKKKLDVTSAGIVPPKLVLKGFASEEGNDEFNKQLIKNRINDVRSYIEPKIPKTVTIEEKPSLDEGKGQVHYREFRSVTLIPGEAKEGLKCGAGAPTVKDCPEPYELFNKAVDRGVQMIDDAKKKLPPKTPEHEKLVFEDLFRPKDPKDSAEKDKIITDVIDILDKIAKHINNLKKKDNHICATECDGGCQAGSPAYNRDTPNKGDEGKMFICSSYEKETDQEQSIIAIHEGHHGVPGIESDDIAYANTRLIKLIDKDSAMKNAASFHMLVKLLLEDPKKKTDQVGPKVDDEHKGGMTASESKDIDLAIAWIEQWFSLITFDTASHYSDIVKVREKKSWVFDDDTARAFFRMKEIFSPRFGLTMPATLPKFEDQKAIAAVNDRLEQMEKPFGSKLTIEKTASGKDTWEPGPKTKIDITQDFFKLPPSRMTIALLQELVHATPNISASLEPEYVLFINDMRNRRKLGGPTP